MEESDSSGSDCSLGEILMKYRKKLKEERISKRLSIESSSQNSNINININVPSTSGTTSVSVSLESEVASKKPPKTNISKKPPKNKKNLNSKMPKAQTSKSIVINENKKNETDPDYAPKSKRNYSKLSAKQLNSIAGRVRIYHETGVVVSDDEEVNQCQNKYKRQKKNEPGQQRGPQVAGTHFGQGRVGVAWGGNFGARRCACCNLSKNKCTSRNRFANLTKGMSEQMLKKLKQREERLLQVQQRDLTRHPELIDLDHSAGAATPLPPPPELSQDKRDLIQKFIDSMSADRIDYEKPKQLNIVEGISLKRPSNVHPIGGDEFADSLDAKTIVQRIDFEKERERRSRLNHHQLDEWLTSTITETLTPKFHVNELNATSTPRTTVLQALTGNLAPIQESASSRQVPETSRTENLLHDLGVKRLPADPVPSTSKMTDNDLVGDSLGDYSSRSNRFFEDIDRGNLLTSTKIGPALDDGSSEFSHLDRSNITIRTPQSKTKKVPLNPEKESDIMNFVDLLMAPEEEAINQEAHEHCERMLKTTETARNLLHDALDDVLITSGNSPDRCDHGLDNSIEIIDEIPATTGNNNPTTVFYVDDSVQLIESDEEVIPINEPSTSRPVRKTRSKRALQVGASRAAKKRNTNKSKTKLPSISEIAPPPPTCSEPATSKTEDKSSARNLLGDCSVCLESLANKEISSTTCGHVFCTPCITAAVRAQRLCPNCRTSLTLKKIHPLFI